MKNIYLRIPLEETVISDLVLATVVRTSGSTPQKPGSSALFNRSGLIAGTVGGGILEGKVQEIAKKSATSKKSGLYMFRLDKNISSGEDALCGGTVTVLIDSNVKSYVNVFGSIRKSADSRIPGVLITMVNNIYDESVLIDRYWMTGDVKPSVPQELSGKLWPEVREILTNSDPYEFRELEISIPDEQQSSLFFLQPVIPRSRLIIAGAGHIGKALSTIAQMLDFEITVIDDRPEFANKQNLPDADHVITGNIGKEISQFEKGEDTFIVIVTRGHRDDASALKACVRSDSGYIGMIGSKNKIVLMFKEFITSKWASQEQLDRIHAPIGIDINSKSVEEIAVSIAAQLVQIRNKKFNKKS